MEAIKPVVGMGVTKVLYSDRHAYTIVRVSDSGKTFWMQRDEAIRMDGLRMSDQQIYQYERQANAPVLQVRQRKDGRWFHDSCPIVLDWRNEYYDYSF